MSLAPILRLKPQVKEKFDADFAEVAKFAKESENYDVIQAWDMDYLVQRHRESIYE